MAQEGEQQLGYIPGPEGPGGTMQQRREYEAAMTRLNDPTPSMSQSEKSRACIDDLKHWINQMGIDSENLEELLIADVMKEREELKVQGRTGETQEDVDESKSKYYENVQFLEAKLSVYDPSEHTNRPDGQEQFAN